jgi:uncharacterized Ntn-hydrolase superfamily protein
VEWCGSVAAEGVSVAGNMLAGEAVIAETLATFQVRPAASLPEKLMMAMLAGEAAGGDRRGRQSAAMRLITTEDFPDLDLRVDDHPDPLAELDRLLELWWEQGAPRLALSPRRDNPSGVVDLDTIEVGWRARGLDLRFRR